jgi:perosamine synthetase
MLRFVPPAGTPLELADILRGAKAALANGDSGRSLRDVAEQIHARRAVGTCSGRAALWLVLKALHRLRPDRNIVALPAYTCFTVPASVVRAGLKLCPVDINPGTLDFDFNQLERVSAAGLLCVVTSNLCGLPNDVEQVRQIAEAKDAFVVDDAAQALGASCNGSWAGLRGDAGVFSFGRGKALAAMEGGLAVTNSEEIAAALTLEAERLPNASSSHAVRLLLEILVYCALLDPRLYWIPNSIPFLRLGATEFAPGFPISRMAGLTVGFLCQTIGKLTEINAGRVKNADSIICGLAGHPKFTVPTPAPGAKPVYTRLPVIASDASTRDRAVAQLHAAGIGASPFYPAAICDIPGIEPFAAPRLNHCPMAESLAKRLFTLPTHSYVKERDLDRIVEILAGIASTRSADLRFSGPRLFGAAGPECRVPSPEPPSLEPRTPDPGPRVPNPKSRPKRLLLVAFDFPPRRTSGIYRPTGLAKYLIRLGWKATVLTVQADGKDLQDPALLARIPPQTEVVRTRFLNFMAWEDSTAGAVRNLGGLSSDSNSSRSSIVDRCLRRLAEFVRSCLYFPDDTAGWVPFGLWKAIELHRRERFAVVYTTSPPRSSLVIGLFLRILLRVPWVAEFRDPWYPPERKMRGWAERRLLSLIGRVADAVVVVTSGHADDFRSLGIPAQKIKVVPNGFDEEDFHLDRSPAGNGLLKPGYLNLTHLGTIYPNCSGKFFEALKELIHESPGLCEKLRVNIIGYPDEAVRRYAEDDALRPFLNMRGFIGHSHSIDVMRSSECLLLFWANQDFAQLAIAGKTYEYLRSGRPILAITYNGPMKALIQQGSAGWVIHPDDKHAMKQALQTILTAGPGLGGKQSARAEYAAQFRYDRLAARMATVFDGISRNRRPVAAGHGHKCTED